MKLADLFKRFTLLPDPEDGLPDRNFQEIFSDAKSDDLRTLSLGDVPEDWDEEDVSNTAVHAYRLLAMRGDPGDVEHFMKVLLVWEDSFVAEVFTEETDWIMEQMGESAIPELLSVIRNPMYPELDRLEMIEGLKYFLAEDTAVREILAACQGQLLELKPERLVNGYLVDCLASFGDETCHETIKIAFDANVVDVSFGGDLEEVEIRLGVRSERKTPAPNFYELEQQLSKDALLDSIGEFPENGDLFEKADYLIQLYRTEASVRNASMLDGVYATVVCSPTMIRPGAIFPLVWDVNAAEVGMIPEFESEKEAQLAASVVMDFYNEINSAVRNLEYVPGIHMTEDPDGFAEPIVHPAPWVLGVFLAAGYLEGQFGPGRYTRRLSEAAMEAMRRCSGGEVFDVDSLADLVTPIIEIFFQSRKEIDSRRPAPGNYSGNPISDFSQQPTSPLKKIGRNDPCPCGSGRKYKKCCAN